MKITPAENRSLHAQIYERAYWVHAGLDMNPFDIDFVKSDYIEFLKLARKNPTLADTIKQDVQKTRPITNPANYSANSVALENNPLVDVFLKKYNEAFQTKYPKTGNVRKIIIKLGLLSPNNTTEKTPKFIKKVVKLRALLKV